MDLPAYACHECAHTHAHARTHRHRHTKTYVHKQQGEGKAINVSELVMHHTAALIDRWLRETVPFMFKSHTHTH